MNENTIILTPGQRFTAYDLWNMGDVFGVTGELVAYCTYMHDHDSDGTVRIRSELDNKEFWCDPAHLNVINAGWTVYSTADLLQMAGESEMAVA